MPENIRIPLTKEALINLSEMLKDLAVSDEPSTLVNIRKIKTNIGELNIFFVQADAVSLRCIELSSQSHEQN